MSNSSRADRPGCACLKYDDINVGDVYHFERSLTREELLGFAEITGDFNPLHTDPQFGKQSRFKENIIQGMLAGSLFSTLVGMHCPGENCIYLSQTLDFRNPIFPGDKLTVKGTVLGKTDATKLLVIKTEIVVKGKIAVAGEAKVIVGEGE